MKYDFCIIGSGFSGSLLAWILARAGRQVVMVDAARHPRFAIGESSTPLADFLLDRLSERFALPELKPLARFGSWQDKYPGLTCGLKRGFSYFSYRPGEVFQDDLSHSSSLLVAASDSESKSDTHWLRSDIDAWLVDRARNGGARVYEGVELQVEMTVNEAWHVSLHNGETSAGSFEADFMVDASGSGRPIASAVGIEDISDRLKTRTGALFGHFEGVASAVDLAAASAGLDKREYLLPFSADDAAQHHLLGQDVWCWMLRFLNGRTSVGIVGPESNFRDLVDATARQDAWRKWIEGFPSLAQLLTDARLVAPTQKDARGIDAAYLGWRPRISRCWAQAAASPEGTLKAGGWAMLPSTVGVIDPLHSTGIAHSLSGVDRLASALLASQADAAKQLRGYSRDVVQEVLWIDEIVSVCRLAQSINFEAFTAASAFYFVAAIHSERQLAGSGELPTGFLLHADQRLRRLVSETRHRLLALHNTNNREPDATRRFVDWLRYQLADWNDVGLLDPALKNRIARAAAPK